MQNMQSNSLLVEQKTHLHPLYNIRFIYVSTRAQKIGINRINCINAAYKMKYWAKNSIYPIKHIALRCQRDRLDDLVTP